MKNPASLGQYGTILLCWTKTGRYMVTQVTILLENNTKACRTNAGMNLHAYMPEFSYSQPTWPKPGPKILIGRTQSQNIPPFAIMIDSGVLLLSLSYR